MKPFNKSLFALVLIGGLSSLPTVQAGDKGSTTNRFKIEVSQYAVKNIRPTCEFTISYASAAYATCLENAGDDSCRSRECIEKFLESVVARCGDEVEAAEIAVATDTADHRQDTCNLGRS